MCEDIKQRVIKEAEYIAKTGATVRETAIVFHFSKSTVHKDVSERLKNIDKVLYKKVKKVLDINLSERHIRGGLATKKKYEHQTIKTSWQKIKNNIYLVWKIPKLKGAPDSKGEK